MTLSAESRDPSTGMLLGCSPVAVQWSELSMTVSNAAAVAVETAFNAFQGVVGGVPISGAAAAMGVDPILLGFDLAQLGESMQHLIGTRTPVARNTSAGDSVSTSRFGRVAVPLALPVRSTGSGGGARSSSDTSTAFGLGAGYARRGPAQGEYAGHESAPQS